MTSSIIPFPTMWDRDQKEFEHHGRSNYTHAVEQASGAWQAAFVEAPRADRDRRVREFAAKVLHLASYRDDLPMVRLPNGTSIALAAMPVVLEAAIRKGDLLASCDAPTARSL